MGMGKTVQTISLLLTDFDASAKKRKHTLVVAPTVAIVQWRNEIAKYTDVFKVRFRPFIVVIRARSTASCAPRSPRLTRFRSTSGTVSSARPTSRSSRNTTLS